MKKDEKVKQVYQIKSKKELLNFYNAWSNEYDNDMINKYLWSAPKHTADFFIKHVKKDAKILDAGCGTGLLGFELNQNGFTNLTGIDFCDQMLSKADTKKSYNSLHRMTLGKTLTFDDKFFDCIVCVGVFTLGHVGPEGLVELSRILKPSGSLVLGMRPDIYYQKKFMAYLRRLNLKLFVKTPIFKPMPIQEPDIFYQIFLHAFGHRIC